MNGDGITNMAVKQRPPDRRFNADNVMKGICTDGGYQSVDLLLVILRDVDGHFLIDTNLILRCILDNLRRAEHPLQIADPAVVMSVFSFCGIIFEILRTVTLCGSFCNGSGQLRTELDPPHFNFCFNFGYIALCQTLSHDLPLSSVL